MLENIAWLAAYGSRQLQQRHSLTPEMVGWAQDTFVLTSCLNTAEPLTGGSVPDWLSEAQHNTAVVLVVCSRGNDHRVTGDKDRPGTPEASQTLTS
jgi:hypothetical protein